MTDVKSTPPWRWAVAWILLAFISIAWLLRNEHSREPPPTEVSYSTFLSLLEAGQVQRAKLHDKEIFADLRDAVVLENGRWVESTSTTPQVSRIVAKRLPNMDESHLLQELRQREVDFSGDISEPGIMPTLLVSGLVPFVVLIGLYIFLMRRASGGAAGAMSFGRNRAKIYDASRQDKVTFDDVAGVDEALDELREVVDFLRNPQKYRSLGARIPRGVLLLGSPGTGKTLIARAVAGEAGVAFFSISGSDFVEMFVGVGASRVRDLFKQARERAPCMVFIDEIDAIGRSRGGMTTMATHDEREQTLNQLLAEMDGFDSSTGVIIMGATNRPEILDPALVRSGRFDRQIVVDAPDVNGRHAILKVHVRKLTLDNDVDLQLVARRTPGMVGADLAKLANEAALGAARRHSTVVGQADFEEAIDRIQLGLKKRGNAMSEGEKRRIAYHEAGHTVVALSVKHADPVHKVTIIPRSIGALGATLQLPNQDQYLFTREQLRDRLCVLMAGRAAEEIFCEDISTGAQNDLERASETARQMVCRFGMSAKLGAQTFGRSAGGRFLQTPYGMGEERNFSEETARAIDAEVDALLREQHERARKILDSRRELLQNVAEALIDKETLEREDLEKFIIPQIGSAMHERAHS